MAQLGKRNPLQADYTVGFDSQGKLLAVQINYYMDCGSYINDSIGNMQMALVRPSLRGLQMNKLALFSMGYFGCLIEFLSIDPWPYILGLCVDHMRRSLLLSSMARDANVCVYQHAFQHVGSCAWLLPRHFCDREHHGACGTIVEP